MHEESETKKALDAQLHNIIADAQQALYHLRSGNPIEHVISKAESCCIRQHHVLKLVDTLKVDTMKTVGENLLKKEAVS